jgi:hypothetical protein
MPEPPRHKRFQVHLSTGIVMMFVAGGILWANITPRITRCITVHEKFKNEMECLNLSYGWPREVYFEGDFIISDSDKPFRGALNYIPIQLAKRLSVNVAIALAILFSVWFACEWRIRRRAARKEA